MFEILYTYILVYEIIWLITGLIKFNWLSEDDVRIGEVSGASSSFPIFKKGSTVFLVSTWYKLKKTAEPFFYFKINLDSYCNSFVFSCMMREALKMILLVVVLITGNAGFSMIKNNKKKTWLVCAFYTILRYDKKGKYEKYRT